MVTVNPGRITGSFHKVGLYIQKKQLYIETEEIKRNQQNNWNKLKSCSIWKNMPGEIRIFNKLLNKPACYEQ